MWFAEWLNRIVAAWRRFPEQVKRLTVFVAFLVAAFIPARAYFVPADFGELGHYRTSALEANAAFDIHYAGDEICNECHDVADVKAAGYHKGLSCEVCHGPSADHIASVESDDPDVEFLEPRAPRGRGYCPLCHEYLSSRPTGFPQIVTASHNPRKPCIECHDPHDPVPPETPQDCSACHAAIARTKAVSHHVYLECTECHNVPEEHKVMPRRHLPSKPSSNEECGVCHDRKAESSVPPESRVDTSTHGEGYVCWQCHYPHLPEAR